MAARTYDFDLVAHHAVAFHVEVVEHDAAFALVDVPAYRLIVIHDVSASVLVEKERRVDASHFGQVDGFAPAFGRVFRLYEEIAGPHVGRNHVEGLVLFVVSDSRREDASRYVLAVEGELRLAVEHMSQLRPVHEVLAREDGHAGEKRERRVDQIIGVPLAADGGVGVESGQDGVEVLAAAVYFLVETGVAPAVGEIAELCRLCCAGHIGRHQNRKK